MEKGTWGSEAPLLCSLKGELGGFMLLESDPTPGLISDLAVDLDGTLSPSMSLCHLLSTIQSLLRIKSRSNIRTARSDI